MASLLRDEELTRYYDLAGATLAPVGAPPSSRSHTWLLPLVDAAESAPLADKQTGALARLDLDVQGIHCAACVWLMNETFRRCPGHVALTVNPALGKARLTWRRGVFDVSSWITTVERFGYQFGPSRKSGRSGGDAVLWRLGVAAALTMNVMLFSISFYFGLSPADGDLFTLFSRLALVLSSGVVAVGGWPFFRSAVRGLRAGVLHLDLPIALGIVLVYGTSLAQVFKGHEGQLTYLDTLNVFITLMLLGRFLQQRVLDKNRRLLLADDGAEGLFVRRIRDAGIEIVRAPAIRRADRLLVAPGELIPVDARLIDRAAQISTDWITGEMQPREISADARMPAGSFNAGGTAFTIEAEQDFTDSPLGTLLRQTTTRAGAVRHMRFWDRLARRWVLGVLAVSTLGCLIWLPRGGGRALDVAVALLVVTCPCAIGIALPLAYEIVQARLRRAGFYVRSTDLLDRLERTRKVVFDKTGTLTLQRLSLVPNGALESLDGTARDVAYNLACRSGHPVAACVAGELRRAGAQFTADATVTEVPGAGLEWMRPDGLWRLGRPDWATPDARQTSPLGTVLSRDGVPVGHFSTNEMLRPGAVGDIAALRAAGYDIHLLSGDAPARVAALASRLGLEPSQAHGGRTPTDKASDVAEIGGANVLYLGDGANDALAFGEALCAGTVAIERPILPDRSDFFIVGETLAPLRLALAEAHHLRRVARRVLALSTAYNVTSVAACLAGVMTPLRAALFMPLSSLSILLFTVLVLRPRVDRRSPAFAIRPEGAR